MSNITSIKEFHSFSGHPAQFWTAFLAFTSQQIQANNCILLIKKSSWEQQLQWPTPQQANKKTPLSEHLIKLADRCLQKRQAVLRGSNPAQPILIGLAVQEQTVEHPRVIIFQLSNSTPEQLDSHLRQLQLLADAPAIYQLTRNQRNEQHKQIDLTQTMELLLLLNQQEKFLAAAMTVVNETVSRFHCSRVSLGWQVDGYICLQSISHMEQFEPKMEIVNQLEAAMEEAFDQDEEIFFPAVVAAGPINRDHASYAKNQQIGQLLSLPLRAAGQVVGVLTCERDQDPFSEEEIRSLRILCDQISS
ncbi:MAG: GAF domain-containing protein, partial [Desulfuromusa sp.]|nr:GAF domain-containing protein [Desulfuromusa sp.]